MTDPAYAMQQSNFAEMYERVLVAPLFEPWVATLLEHAGLEAGERVLDLACGTGIVARLAKARVGDRGRVVGLDRSAQMLAVARGVAPDVEWREADALALPFDATEKFDVVICQQGLQFFADQPAAVCEMRRVLNAGGRLAVAVWRALEEMPFFMALHRVAEQHVGPVADQRYGFGDAKRLEALLTGAGFHDVRVETLSRDLHFADALAFARMNAMALVGMSPGCAKMNDEQRFRLVAAIVDASAQALAPFGDGTGGAVAHARTNLATGRA